jgi:hypothetical protein
MSRSDKKRGRTLSKDDDLSLPAEASSFVFDIQTKKELKKCLTSIMKLEEAELFNFRIEEGERARFECFSFS